MVDGLGLQRRLEPVRLERAVLRKNSKTADITTDRAIVIAAAILIDGASLSRRQNRRIRNSSRCNRNKSHGPIISLMMILLQRLQVV